MSWITPRIRSDQGKALAGRLAAADPAKKSQLLRAEARKEGLTACPLADLWDQARTSDPSVSAKAR